MSVDQLDTFFVTCVCCQELYGIEIRLVDYTAWREGALIQNVMPYLSDSERELLISQTCDSCFKSMFSGEGDEECPTSKSTS